MRKDDWDDERKSIDISRGLKKVFIRTKKNEK